MRMPLSRAVANSPKLNPWRRILLSLTLLIIGVALVSFAISLHHVNSIDQEQMDGLSSSSSASFQLLPSRSDFQQRRFPDSAGQAVTSTSLEHHVDLLTADRRRPSLKETRPDVMTREIVESERHRNTKSDTHNNNNNNNVVHSAESSSSSSSSHIAQEQQDQQHHYLAFDNTASHADVTSSVQQVSSPGTKTKVSSSSVSTDVANNDTLGEFNISGPRGHDPNAASASTSTSTHIQQQQEREQEQGILLHPQTETDALCPSCRFASVGIGPTNNGICMEKMQLKMTKENLTLIEAGKNLALRRPGYCGRCDPQACSVKDKQYWRFDSAGPIVLAAHTHYLQSIGSEARLPVSALDNLTAFFSNDQNVHPKKDYLFEFNPSLVPLPASQIPTNIAKDAVYLASYRVSNMHNCVTDPDTMLRMVGGKWPRRSAQVKDYLGLALLRADLTIAADTVIDAKEVVHKLQDVRLFVLQDQIYVGSYHRMTPLWLVPPPPSNATIVVPNLWESSMSVTLRTFGSCTKDRDIQRKGKNLNYFVDADNRTMMEMYPKGPKEEIELSVRCIKSAPEDPPGVFVFPNKSAVPLPSFGTVEELHFARERIWDPQITGDRGSSCCVPITSHNGQRLLLGIAHSKTRYNHKQGTDVSLEGQVQANHFFSSFYAIQDRPPYNVVARSGKFCLGFAHKSDNHKSDKHNPYTRMNIVPLSVMGETYQCPRIHFVSGMIEKVDDPSKVILSYGINDCVPRMVVIAKTEIMQMLFDANARLAPTETPSTTTASQVT